MAIVSQVAIAMQAVFGTALDSLARSTGTRSGVPACGSAGAGPPKRAFQPNVVGLRSLRDLVPPYAIAFCNPDFVSEIDH